METMAKYKPNLEITPDTESLAHRSVEFFMSDARKVLSSKDIFCVAISGGHTPRRFYELLGKDEKTSQLPWDKIHLFWVDERYVPPDSPFSNYKLAAESFLDKISIPRENVHRICTECSDLQEAAQNYEAAIRQVFELGENQLPQFDLIMLGMGEDGHTGSLFPNSYAPFDTEDLACVVYALGSDLARITVTHPVLCAALHLVVLVSGKEKAEILKKVLTSEPDEVRFPIHVLWPILDKITWLIDGDAAKLL
jgi:6-phosphogluconolactonase